MPELPEVHTLVKGLKDKIEQYSILEVEIQEEYKNIKNHQKFIEKIKGKTIGEIHRLSKNIIFTLGSDLFLSIHLAMTGRLILGTKQNKDKWVRLILLLTKDEQKTSLMFSDIRKFGRIKLLNREELKNLEKSYGIEPIRENTNPREFFNKIKRKQTPIKTVLLDQKVISGLGNIYATEALFESKISPFTKSRDLTEDQVTKLLQAAKRVLEEGIKNRGTTMKDKRYVDLLGNEGTHQNFLKVYNQKTCPNCKSQIEHTKLGGRGTYYCPNCQK